MYCHRCGKELPQDALYCINCGAKVGEYSPAERWWEWRMERRRRHEWDPVDAAWGAVSAVGFLVILGLTIAEYPDVITLLVRYLESWGTYGHPVLPPYALGQAIIFLFTAGGIWGLVSSALRLTTTNRIARPMRNVVGAGFSLFIAFVLYEFYANAIHGAEVVLAFFIGLAAMVLLDALIDYYIPRKKAPVPAPPA